MWMWLTMPHVDLRSAVVIIVGGDGQSTLTPVPSHCSMCSPLGWVRMKVVFTLLTIKLSTVVIDHSEVLPLIFSFLTGYKLVGDNLNVMCYSLPPVVSCLCQLVAKAIGKAMHILPLKYLVRYVDKSI